MAAAAITPALLSATMCLAEPGPAPKAKPDPASAQERAIRASYDFSIGGISIAEVHVGARVKGASYNAEAKVLTRGVLDFILKGRVASRVAGQRSTHGRLVPGTFLSNYETRTGAQTLEIGYKGVTPEKVSYTPPSEDDEPRTKVEPETRIGSLDPLSAAIATLMPSTEAVLCNRTIPVFDGTRRYDVILLAPEEKKKGEVAPPPKWDKPLRRCFGIYERIGGFDPDTMEDGKYFPFDVWFEETGKGVFRPVRLAGKTRLGFAIGDLRRK